MVVEPRFRRYSIGPTKVPTRFLASGGVLQRRIWRMKQRSCRHRSAVGFSALRFRKRLGRWHLDLLVEPRPDLRRHHHVDQRDCRRDKDRAYLFNTPTTHPQRAIRIQFLPCMRASLGGYLHWPPDFCLSGFRITRIAFSSQVLHARLGSPAAGLPDKDLGIGSGAGLLCLSRIQTWGDEAEWSLMGPPRDPNSGEEGKK